MTPSLTQNIQGVTMAGSFNSNRVVTLQNFKIPGVCPDTTLKHHEARVFGAPCKYDMIVGRDALRHFKIKLNFEDNLIEHKTHFIPMSTYPRHCTSSTELAYHLYLDNAEPSNLFDAFALSSDKEILAADYRPADIRKVAYGCTHLTQDQRDKLYDVLKDFSEVFDGKLRHYPDEEIHLDVDPNATPHRRRPYPVPHSQLKRFKQELDRLVSIGVLAPQGRSTWISGTFIIPKKDQSVRWISDFRALNKVIKRKVYHIPRIQDILSRRSGYKFLSKLDISMQYYTFVLDDASKDLTTIATPFGLFKYNRLPMGINQSPDIAQEAMERVLQDIKDIEIYIDDIAVFSNDFDSHMQVLRQVLERLKAKGFIANPRKCEWAVKETDFLGHWLTPEGVKPYHKKVKAILNMLPPKNIKQLRAFLGLVTYYRDMWPRRSHTLAPLTELLRNPKSFKWKPIHDRAFQAMKALVAQDTLLVYPDHNKPFHIETDASDYQLGAVIKQGDRPVAFYTRKLNPAQRNYTTIEKELLSVVETLKEFRSMLLGAELHVYTDHRNLTHKLTSFTTQRVLRWRLTLEEFNPQFHYIKGTDNTVADALSRTPTTTYCAEFQMAQIRNGCPESDQIDDLNFNQRPESDQVDDLNYIERPESDRPESDQIDDLITKSPESDSFVFTDLAECLLATPTCDAPDNYIEDMFLFYPRFDPRGRHPFHFDTIHHYQQNDPPTMQLAQDGRRYFYKHLDTFAILCRRDTLDEPDGPWKIVIPTPMLAPLVKWYHEVTVHSTGMDRLEALIRRHFHHPDLRPACRNEISRCRTCPQVRVNNRPAGQLAPRNAPILPWHEVHVDFIGPWNVRVNGQAMKFDALTCIDPVTNLVEIVRLRGRKNAANAARLFANHWLSRYPRPAKIVHDNGPEFNGHDFQIPLEEAGIRRVNVSPNTPQANSIIEASHKAIGQVIRTLIHLRPPQNRQDAENLIDNAFGTAMHALRCNPVITLGNYSPGALVFNRDMFFNLPLVADILTLTQNRQALVDQRLLRANARRTRHEFRVQDMVFVNIPDRHNKLNLVRRGPFPIIQVHTNNTVTLQRGPIQERISIRHLTPFRPNP